jgi:hypothetical protein
LETLPGNDSLFHFHVLCKSISIRCAADSPFVDIVFEVFDRHLGLIMVIISDLWLLNVRAEIVFGLADLTQ